MVGDDMLTRLYPGLLAIASAALFAPAATAQKILPGTYSEQVVTVTAGTGRAAKWVRYLLIIPNQPKSGDAVMLFAGRDGLLSLAYDGTIGTNLSGNFLVRSRLLFVDKGLPVAVVDAPNGMAMDGNDRLSVQYATFMSDVISDVRAKTAARRVWLVGTSAGTLSVAGIAARYPRSSKLVVPPLPNPNLGRPDGVVLTSTQSHIVPNVCGKIVQNADLATINVPAYLVAHHDDACGCSPPSGAQVVLNALTGTTRKANVEFTGGNPPTSTDPCQAFTPHGFLGIEDAVISNIAAFIATH
jgi:hypothetical protein